MAETRQIGIRVDLATYRALEAMASAGGHKSVTTLAGSIIAEVEAATGDQHDRPAETGEAD